MSGVALMANQRQKKVKIFGSRRILSCYIFLPACFFVEITAGLLIKRTQFVAPADSFVISMSFVLVFCAC